MGLGQGGPPEIETTMQRRRTSNSRFHASQGVIGRREEHAQMATLNAPHEHGEGACWGWASSY